MQRVWTLLAAILLPILTPANGQPIRIGELNSYKAQPAFLEPYRKGWVLALEEINASGGILGRPVEVISRDDMGTPGDAVRVAEGLVSKDRADIIFGTFLSNVGLAVGDFARQRRVVFLAAEPLTDKLTWQNGNRYTFRLAPSTYMQVAMLIPEALRLKKQRWALVYPNYEYGQSASETFKTLLRAAQPNVEFVAEYAPPLGRIDAGAIVQSLADSKPDAVFNALFGTDLAKFVRAGITRGVFEGRKVVSLLSGWPEYLEPLGGDVPEGWIVTGYPWHEIHTPAHVRFLEAYRRRWKEHPRMGSVIGYSALRSIAALIAKAGAVDTERLVAGFEGLEVTTPFGPIKFRAIDHQSTMGSFVGEIVRVDGRGMLKTARFVDGSTVMPSDSHVRRLRPAN